jgi:hypothetical protein
MPITRLKSHLVILVLLETYRHDSLNRVFLCVGQEIISHIFIANTLHHRTSCQLQSNLLFVYYYTHYIGASDTVGVQTSYEIYFTFCAFDVLLQQELQSVNLSVQFSI